jgi:hypothetical protein
MAYLDIAEHYVTATPAAGLLEPATLRGLNDAECSTISLARVDRRASIRPAGPPSKAVEMLFGLKPIITLADPRPEALRCFAVAVAHDTPAAAERESAALRRGGYSDAKRMDAAAVATTYRGTKMRSGRPTLARHAR